MEFPRGTSESLDPRHIRYAQCHCAQWAVRPRDQTRPNITSLVQSPSPSLNRGSSFRLGLVARSHCPLGPVAPPVPIRPGQKISEIVKLSRNSIPFRMRSFWNKIIASGILTLSKWAQFNAMGCQVCRLAPHRINLEAVCLATSSIPAGESGGFIDSTIAKASFSGACHHDMMVMMMAQPGCRSVSGSLSGPSWLLA